MSLSLLSLYPQPLGGEGEQDEATWEPTSMKKAVQKQRRLQEGSRGAPGSLLGPFWEPFFSICACVFVFCHVFVYDFLVEINVFSCVYAVLSS